MILLLTFDTKEDCDKFLQVYETYKKTIYYTLLRFRIDAHTIEDLSQDAWLIIADHLDDLDLANYKRTQNYIITLTRNLCKNYLRSQKQKKEQPLEELEPLSTAPDGILDQLISQERIQRLAKEIRQLDDIYKSVLELKYINNLKNEEIASALGIKKKTVEMRLYRSRSILQNKLKEQEHGQSS